MVSLKDIAKECNVSPGTVSKALNGQTDVSEETRAYITSVAKKMGYFPNSSARALKTNRSYNIGVLFVDRESQSGLTHDYFSSILDSFKRGVEAKGYDITFISSSKGQANSMTYLEHCRYRGFDGVVIACVDFEDPEVEELAKSGLPLVTIDHVYYGRSAILSDNVKGMKDLLSYIISKGHRRIAYIHGLKSTVTSGRLTSFFKTLDENGIEIPDEYIKESPYRNTRLAAEKTEELLALKKRPTCILYPDDYSCFGGINAIREHGLRIPEDISVAGFDGIKIGRHIEPRLTTLRQDMDTIGLKAAEQLIDLIERPKTTIEGQIVIDGEVYEGKTVGTAPQI